MRLSQVKLRQVKCQLVTTAKQNQIFVKIPAALPLTQTISIQIFQNSQSNFWRQNPTIPSFHIRPPLEKKAINILENETLMKNGHFETPCLWKKGEAVFPNDRDSAIKRFMSLEKKFCKNQEFSKMYHVQINEYIKKTRTSKRINKTRSTKNFRHH